MDRLENKLDGKAEIVRLDVTSQIGRRAAGSYGVRGTPTLIVVDGSGEPVLTQLSLVRPGPVINQVETLLAQAN